MTNYIVQYQAYKDIYIAVEAPPHIQNQQPLNSKHISIRATRP